MQLNQQTLSLAGLMVASILSVVTLWLGLSVSDGGADKFGTVDMHALILEQSQSLAKAYPTGQVPPRIMQQVVEDIKGVIERYGQDQKLTLLAKGAVLSFDVPEHTEIVKAILNEERPQRRKA
jgi:hypothetical protein